MIILSEDFQRFVLRAGRFMERALSENVDIYLDYIGGGDNEEANDEKSHARLSLNRVFYDDRWSKNRCITCMDWSTHFPELVVASYHNNEVRWELFKVYSCCNTGISAQFLCVIHDLSFEIRKS